jgi:hypothetical protein
MPPRKKKSETAAAVANVESIVDSVVEVDTEGKNGLEVLDSLPTQDTPLIKTRAKREKRASKHKVVALVTADGIQGAFQSETRKPLIAHLPIHSSEVKFHDQPFTYDPRPPAPLEAYNAADIDPFSNEAAYEATEKTAVADSDGTAFTLSMGATAESAPAISSAQKQTVQSSSANLTTAPVSEPSRKEYGPTTLLVQFANTAHTHELPSETSLACFWCCEEFPGKPCVIPMRIVEKVWHVYGNFCTPQCCMAYLLSELLDAHVRWERIALLSRLYGNQFNGRIYPAPSRESLQRFGGPISITDFRSICDSQRVRVDIHYPPMVSILASMDTKPIDFYETSMRGNYVPQYNPQKVIQEQGSSQLKLKRTKPLKEKENTLDACLNITVMSH